MKGKMTIEIPIDNNFMKDLHEKEELGSIDYVDEAIKNIKMNALIDKLGIGEDYAQKYLVSADAEYEIDDYAFYDDFDKAIEVKYECDKDEIPYVKITFTDIDWEYSKKVLPQEVSVYVIKHYDIEFHNQLHDYLDELINYTKVFIENDNDCDIISYRDVIIEEK